MDDTPEVAMMGCCAEPTYVVFGITFFI